MNEIKNNPFDFFSEIYCINIDRRIDRWEECQKEFKKIGILDRVQRFSAIEHKDGRIGVIKSNLEIVKMARDKNLDNVLVFEDDVKFFDNISVLEILEKSLNQINKLKWSLFYLGANTHKKLTKINKNLILLKDSFAVHSMAYNKLVYNKFISYASKVDKIKNVNDILDVWLANEIQKKYTCLMTNPMLTTQRESYSDIENKIVNYDFIEERFKKNIK